MKSKWIDKLLNLDKYNARGWRIYLAAFILPIIAFAIRMSLLPSLGMGTAFLTFYPIVMLSAIYGGLRAGFLSTIFSTILSTYWMGTIDHRFNPKNSDFLGMGVFILSCALISFVSEAMIQAKKRLQEQTKELIKARDEAEIANKAKSVFLANMSHELRTPLNAILGFSRILSKKNDISAENQKLIGIINRSGDHLLNLINDTLDMAKIEAGGTNVEKSAFDLIELLSAINDLMAVRAEAKQLELVLKIEPGTPQYINGDYSKIRQIIFNLIGNAIKFTLTGGVYADVSYSDSTDNRILKIIIRDTGVGIASENLDKIFMPFFQGVGTGFQKGTGLGLTITKQFVELMNGKLIVESQINTGSKFILDLPVDIVENPELLMIRHETEKSIKLAKDERRYKILIVEDEMENWQLMKSLLEDAGFVVEIAVNGSLGVEAFKSFRPDFIWMDWRMPVMNGLEATKIIRKLEGGETVKIAVISASVFSEQRAEVIAAGLDDFVKKPFRPEEIFSCMQNHLGIKYVYEIQEKPYNRKRAELITAEELEGIPNNYLLELEESIVNLDVNEINSIIRKIYDIAPKTGEKLGDFAEMLEYSVILKSIRLCLGGKNEK